MLKKIIGIFYTILNISLIRGLQVGINTSGKSYYVNEIQTGGNGFACATFSTYSTNGNAIHPDPGNNYPVPPSLDLTSGINLEPVQNQNDPTQCNSCYAFAINSAIQILTQYQKGIFPMTKKTPLPASQTLSAQQIIDCYNTPPPIPNANCISGDIYEAAEYVLTLDTPGGLCAEDGYQYQATQLPSCQLLSGQCPNSTSPYISYNSTSHVMETMNFSSDDLKKYLYLYGPVIVGIDMPAAFKYYSSSSGTYTAGCGTNINSVVVITGYDFTNQYDSYWIARTSFGPDWGINGNIHIDAGFNSTNSDYGKCGIYKYGIILPNPHIITP